jgi:hypothetical protein
LINQLLAADDLTVEAQALLLALLDYGDGLLA